MPKKLFVSDLHEGMNVESIFLVKQKNSAVTKTNKPYLNITLADKTGDVVAKIWDNATAMGELFEKEDFVYVKASVSKYNDRVQLTILDIRKIDQELIKVSDFLPVSPKDVKVMKEDLKKVIAQVNNQHLKKLLHKVFSDPNISERYFSAPAAKGVHHAYLGGLLEHSLNLAEMAIALKPFYKMINFDLVVTGILLHDIGKIRELDNSTSFDYTTEGRLVGHIVIGAEIVSELIKEINEFPQDLKYQLIHIILSHHGELEYGSPKRPKTLEALIVHYIDDMDSKINGVLNFAKDDPAAKLTGWTSFNKVYERYFYMPNSEVVEETKREEGPYFEEEEIETPSDKKVAIKQNTFNF